MFCWVKYLPSCIWVLVQILRIHIKAKYACIHSILLGRWDAEAENPQQLADQDSSYELRNNKKISIKIG